MNDLPTPAIRCAIYTRKSSEDGLLSNLNSLEAQREVCRAYIQCNAHRGWNAVPTDYDDGGFSGSTLERPALQRLIIDIRERRIDVVLFYKIDRLTRSLADFVRLMEALKPFKVSFVSVTQSFDTSDTMGRMILNILLTFAQFEREMMGDRIRDKFEVMRRRGLYIHGLPPLGYDKVDQQLVVNHAEARTVVRIFERVKECTTIQDLARTLCAEGIRSKRWTLRNGRSKGGGPITAFNLYKLLHNPVYRGCVVHGGRQYPARHPAIIDEALWTEVQNWRERRARPRIKWDPERNLLRGLLFDEHGRPLQADATGVSPRAYRSYASQVKTKRPFEDLPIVRVRAERVEELTLASLIAFYDDHSEVRRALLCIGSYVDEPRDLFHRCAAVRARLAQLTREEQRCFLRDQLSRIEISTSELRLFVRCSSIQRLLETHTLADLLTSRAQDGERTHLVTVNAYLQGPYARLRLPLNARSNEDRRSNPELVALLNKAIQLRAEVMRRRADDLREIAASKRMSVNYLSRLIRLTYLAPDIQAAILDGCQPASLTRDRLLYCGLPAAWPQQRALLEFPEPSSGITDCSGHMRPRLGQSPP
ncbi:recombinase family protein [Sphingomonas ginkgonis]|uniref:Recombinase family protein n=1 Tax=Sphingomonas ginkgonis TaxID=2315330 RepID=A0A429VBX2_9SPHN|nr:recombinase family protein [Sphingomonas ginkgonis]RST31322.1 recombinase family protein [Sphingomonas ginkgonis]